MRRVLLAALASVLISLPAVAAQGLDAFLDHVNVEAHADINVFAARLSAQFGVPEAQVRIVLGKVRQPADAFMVFQIGQMAHRDADSVLRVYESHRGRGWGVIAQEMGIKPGSAEFKALKRGELHFGDHEHQQIERPGPGRGHGRGRD